MNLKVTHLFKSYDGKSNALQNVNFDISGIGLYLITGDNGSGKTTLFNLIAGLDKPTGGQIFYNGVDICAMKEKELREYRRNSVSYIFQDYNLIGELSAFDNLALAVGDKNDGAIFDALEKVEMSEYKDKKVRELSEGQKQRIAIARAFIKDSAIVLADEITASLDRDISPKIVALLIELAKVKCVIVITHNREDFAEQFSREIHLVNGQIEYEERENYADANAPAACKIKNKPHSNKLHSKALYKFAVTNLFKRKTKKVYLLVFSTILLTVCLTSISSISIGYKTMISKLMDTYGQRYIFCTAAPDVIKDADYLIDNNYAATMNLDYNFPLGKGMYWLPMIYGRSEHVVELNSNFDDSQILQGNLPSSIDEIAITDYVADFILACGEKGGIDCKTYNEILEKAEITLTHLKISFRLKVVGIINTDYKKYSNLYSATENDLSYNLDETFYNTSLKWKLGDMLNNCSTETDRNFYLYTANVLSYYNVFYVCNDFESKNYNKFRKLNLADDEAATHNVPNFYSINKTDNLNYKTYNLNNASHEGVIAPLSKIIDANTLDDLYSIYQNEESVYSECCKKNIKDVTIQIKELIIKPLESFETNRLVVFETIPVIGFYNDYFQEEQKSEYYLTFDAFEKIVGSLASHTPSAISAYVNFDALNNKKAIISSVLGDYVPNGNLNFPEKLIIDEGYSQLKIVQAILAAVFLLTFALAIGFLAQIIIDDIKENEKNYAIMKSLGSSNLQLIKIALFTPLTLFLVSSLIAVTLSFAGIAILNVWLVKGFFKISIAYVTWYGILGLIATMALSLFFGASIGFRKLIKQPPIKSLKTN